MHIPDVPAAVAVVPAVTAGSEASRRPAPATSTLLVVGTDADTVGTAVIGLLIAVADVLDGCDTVVVLVAVCEGDIEAGLFVGNVELTVTDDGGADV